METKLDGNIQLTEWAQDKTKPTSDGYEFYFTFSGSPDPQWNEMFQEICKEDRLNAWIDFPENFKTDTCYIVVNGRASDLKNELYPKLKRAITPTNEKFNEQIAKDLYVSEVKSAQTAREEEALAELKRTFKVG